MRRFGLYAGVNAFAFAWTLFAVTRPWVGTIAEDPQRELVQRTLLFALFASVARPGPRMRSRACGMSSRIFPVVAPRSPSPRC